MPMQYTVIFHRSKNGYIQKKCGILFWFLRKIDRGYTLEPPRWGGSNEYP